MEKNKMTMDELREYISSFEPEENFIIDIESGDANE